MPRSLRVLAILATLAMVLGAAPAALGAGPTREVIDLDDPAFDVEEAAYWTEVCGFDVGVDNSGHISALVFPDGRRSMVRIDSYHIRTTYTNLATGTSVRLRDIGPDRWYVRNGNLYVGVTGRSTTGSGVIGLVVIDTATGDIVHQSGKDVGLFQDRLCAALGS